MNICMAHRGWSGQAPENTMAAIQMAVDEPNIQSIEVDVQLSQDGVPVIIHDFTLDRTTNGQGSVKEHTYEQLRQLDAGSWFADSFAGERIPTLEEVLLVTQGKCKLNIELKSAGDLYPGLEQKVVDLVQQYHMQSDVFITSFDHHLIKNVDRIDSSIQTGLIVAGRPSLIKEQMQETGASILAVVYPHLTPQWASELINEGITVIAWTIDDPNMIKKIAAMHPEIQICTNHPEHMLNS